MLLRCYSTVTSASQVAACCSALQLLFQPFFRSGSQRHTARSYSCTSSACNSSALTASSASTSSSPAGAEGTGSSSDPSSSTNALKQALDDQDRRGFGGRVALPAEDVLRQQVLASADKPVDLTLRAYHVGSRVHIGQVLARVRSTHPECRTTAGKDYAIIWLDDLLPVTADQQVAGQSSYQLLSWLWRTGLFDKDKPQINLKDLKELMTVHRWLAQDRLDQLQERPLRKMKFRPDLLLHAAKQQLQQQKAEVVTIPLQQPAAPAGSHQAQQLQAEQPPATARADGQQLLQDSGSPEPPAAPGSSAATQPSGRAYVADGRVQQRGYGMLWPSKPSIERATQRQPQQQAQQQQQGRASLGHAVRPLQPPFMAVYRSGSVVFGGLPEKQELLWLAYFVPTPVRYTEEDVSLFLRDRSVPNLSYKEVHKVVVDSGCSSYAVQGDDEVRLRVLDVGGVRVLTSVLAQSAALKFYEESVGQSLERLALWRAAHSGARADRTSGGQPLSFLFKIIWGNKQDKVLFKVIAASALIINEAQQLLEVAEPAWQYDTYNMIWEVMAKDQQLESRIKALEVKLHQVEAEAKHDVKARAGRRSLLLEQGIILLLTISCMLVAMEVGVKLSKLMAADSSNNSQEETGSSNGSGDGLSSSSSGSSEGHSWDGDPSEKLVAVGPR